MEYLIDYDNHDKINAIESGSDPIKHTIKISTSLDSINAVEKELDDVLKGI